MAQNEDYNFTEAEPRIQKFWQDKKIYQFNQKSKKKIYSIDTPPPTVSGKMHIGHAFSYSQQDFIARFHRMLGENVFYPFGTDDNGLPTERLVEKMKGIKARDMPRDEFVKLCLKLLEKKLIPEYISDWKRIGISCDWDILYSTINKHCRRISQRSFIDIYNMKRAYRKDAPAMWCPECRTGISQVDCQNKELESEFNHIIFKCGKQDLVIATTRPELLPACVAVFYHPGDKRYEKLKGKKAKVPLFDFEVPIMEDERASMEKGTGIVMCCTFGDQTDMEWQKAHNLKIKEAISKDGTMSIISGKYSGMPIKMARSKIKQDLKEAGLIIKQEKMRHVVNVHERCGTEIEFVKSQQWFVKYLDLKPEMLKWGRALKWYPEHMIHRYENWVRGLQWDWLISRQRFFGVPFPVWYCKKCGEVILASDDELPVDPMNQKPRIKQCPKCKSREFVAEKDILDTWFTSSMTPRLSAELMPKELEKKIFPMSLRPQASEIITFWLFNTVVKSNLHYKKNPFENVMVSGFATLSGQKMSKSKGNVVEPQSVIEKYGADSLRYWAASSKLGEDIEYQEKEIVAGKKFVTKLWNASKFISINLSNKKPKNLYETDRLFIFKLNNLIAEVTEFMKNYEYARAKNEAGNFFWHVFCDNYLEIVKKRVYSGSKEEKESAAYALYQSLLSILKMMAPITPYITEEVYQKFFKKFEKDESIHISSWPEKIKIKENKDDEEILELLLSILGEVRMVKSKAQKSMKAEIILTLEKEKIDKLKNLVDDLTSVICAREIKPGSFKVEFVQTCQ